MFLSSNFLRGNFLIDNITHFEKYQLNVIDIAERLSLILRENGDEFVDQLSTQEIVNSSQRFYIMCTIIDEFVEIVGMIAVDPTLGEISSLCVVPKYRNKGIGSRLVEYALRVIKEHGVNLNASTYVQENNKVALQLFTNLGFITVDEIGTAKVLRKSIETE